MFCTLLLGSAKHDVVSPFQDQGDKERFCFNAVNQLVIQGARDVGGKVAAKGKRVGGKMAGRKGGPPGSQKS